MGKLLTARIEGCLPVGGHHVADAVLVLGITLGIWTSSIARFGQIMIMCSLSSHMHASCETRPLILAIDNQVKKSAIVVYMQLARPALFRRPYTSCNPALHSKSLTISKAQSAGKPVLLAGLAQLCLPYAQLLYGTTA